MVDVGKEEQKVDAVFNPWPGLFVGIFSIACVVDQPHWTWARAQNYTSESQVSLPSRRGHTLIPRAEKDCFVPAAQTGGANPDSVRQEAGWAEIEGQGGE